LQKGFIFSELSIVDEEKENVSSENIVRIAASLDTGWPTKGLRRSYDSLSGTSSLIGYFNRKVLSHVVLNRKCRMCVRGHPKIDHDCRLNFEGSAKAMEPKAVALLVKNNSILIECNVQVGIFIGDNDSSAICAARNAVDYEIIKQDDLNHTGKGMDSELYKIIKNHKELNSNVIKYLDKYFKYSISQNTGNKITMAHAIKNIPYHFNEHENCGDWCKYRKNPDTYKHSVIGDGLKDQRLFHALQNIFDVLASKAGGFSAEVSSNPNKSLNAMIASKAPKSRMYVRRNRIMSG